MSLNQMNEHLNDSFETYFPNFGPLRKFIYGIATLFVLVTFRLRRKIFCGKILINERIIEYPQVFQWIKLNGDVLDIGCASSRLPIQLASLGYKVHAVDTRPYSFTHRNLHFHQEDLFKWSPPIHFDIILLISTLEHFGLGGYGDLVLSKADKQAVDRIFQWLKEGAQLIVSVPFGKAEITKKHRIYDSKRLKELFLNFRWKEQHYYKREGGSWIPSNSEYLERISSNELPVNGIVLLNLEKP
jgi:SAM-dependent methyltransferase